MTARYLIGDSLTVLKTLPDASVDLVMTSPPFLALRSYLPADHPDKALEMGSEPNPGEFIDALLDIVEECDRVLAPHGSIAFELGDTFSGSGGAGGDYGDQGLRDGQAKFDGTGRRSRAKDVAAGIIAPTNRPGPARRDAMPGWPMDKSLCLIPELFRIALVYGFNPLTGRETPRWRARNVVRWVRPNPPVGALGDKFRPATSDLVIACKSKTRYFDLDAVKEPLKDSPGNRYVRKVSDGDEQGREVATDGIRRETNKITKAYDPTASGGAPPLDWWSIPPGGYPGSHYAVYPPELCVRPIKAMCPERVCTVCGEPSRRMVGEPTYVRNDSDRVPARLTKLDGERPADGVNQHTRPDGANTSVTRQVETLGWTDCQHNSFRSGLVLDPFAGSGTTLMVAEGHGRDSIGIDLDERNADLARERVGLFLEVDEPAPMGDVAS